MTTTFSKKISVSTLCGRKLSNNPCVAHQNFSVQSCEGEWRRAALVASQEDSLYFLHPSKGIASSPASVQTRYRLLIYQRCEHPASGVFTEPLLGMVNLPSQKSRLTRLCTFATKEKP